MRVDIISKEYPPAIYGGAGVHVAELVRALRDRGDVDVQVRCFGAPRDEAGTTAYPDLPELASANPALQTFGVDVTIAQDCQGSASRKNCPTPHAWMGPTSFRSSCR